jgi:hypothetical protein
MDHAKLILDLSTSASEAEAERAGFDAGVNRPNIHNCHFTLFRSRELTAAWERGNARGHEWQQTRMG